jgi:hypothetical protein
VDYFSLDALEHQKEQATMALTPGNPNQPALDGRMQGQAPSFPFRPPEAAQYTQPNSLPPQFANAPAPPGFATATGAPLANPFGAPSAFNVAPPAPPPAPEPPPPPPAPVVNAVSPNQPPGNPFSQMSYVLENDQLVPNNPVRVGRPARNNDGTFISDGQTAFMWDGYGNQAIPPVPATAQNITYEQSCQLSDFYGTARPPADPAMFPELAQGSQPSVQTATEAPYTPPPQQALAPAPQAAAPVAPGANPGGMPRKKAGEDDATYQIRVAKWKEAKLAYDLSKGGTVTPLTVPGTAAATPQAQAVPQGLPMTPKVAAALIAFSEASKALAEAIQNPNG